MVYTSVRLHHLFSCLSMDYISSGVVLLVLLVFVAWRSCRDALRTLPSRVYVTWQICSGIYHDARAGAHNITEEPISDGIPKQPKDRSKPHHQTFILKSCLSTAFMFLATFTQPMTRLQSPLQSQKFTRRHYLNSMLWCYSSVSIKTTSMSAGGDLMHSWEFPCNILQGSCQSKWFCTPEFFRNESMLKLLLLTVTKRRDNSWMCTRRRSSRLQKTAT